MEPKTGMPWIWHEEERAYRKWCPEEKRWISVEEDREREMATQSSGVAEEQNTPAPASVPGYPVQQAIKTLSNSAHRCKTQPTDMSCFTNQTQRSGQYLQSVDYRQSERDTMRCEDEGLVSAGSSGAANEVGIVGHRYKVGKQLDLQPCLRPFHQGVGLGWTPDHLEQPHTLESIWGDEDKQRSMSYRQCSNIEFLGGYLEHSFRAATSMNSEGLLAISSEEAAVKGS